MGNILYIYVSTIMMEDKILIMDDRHSKQTKDEKADEIIEERGEEEMAKDEEII